MHIRLFHKTNSRSQRIIWLLEELELNYELIVDEQIQTHEFRKFPNRYPSLKFPMVQIFNDHSTEVTTLAESAAIAEYFTYLCNKLTLTQCLPTEVPLYFYWKNFAEATFMQDVALKQVFAQIVARTPFPVRLISTFLKWGFDRGYLNLALHQHLLMIDQHLQNHCYLAGDHFTIADILLWFPLWACLQSNPEFESLPHIQHYLQQLQNRPAFQHALQKGHWSAAEFRSYWSKAW